MKNSLLIRTSKHLLGTLLLCIIVYSVVYFAGGTKTPYPHLFYFPIMIAALVGTWAETLLIACVSSLAMSVWMMPMNVELSTPQTGVGWIFRAVMFFSVAIFLKNALDAKQKNQDRILESTRQMDLFSQSTLNAILRLAETKDPDSTGKHLDKISTYAKILLEEIDMEKYEKDNIIRAIALHDIGKVAIPDSILLKPGRLTEEEYSLMKQHSVIGGDIIREMENSFQAEESDLRNLFRTATDIVYYHHERADGKGYPKGLMLEEIPMAARITALCDVYEALSSVRPYKEAYPHHKCIDIITAERGKQFDPLIVDAFIKVEKQFEEVLIWQNLGDTFDVG